ncbi:MAG TPA: DUF2267 domain-containing protein [Chloroflexi bacterium]|nr:DUF2267 domain-containing protein [Chloroflexota bacterium]
MQFDEFVGRVHNRAELASTGEALRAIRATLQTLSERVYFDEAQDLAAQLPREIGEYLTMVDDVESFSLGEFLDRVAERETVDLPDATYHARVVIEVLGETVTPGKMDDIRAQLPDEYKPLFEAGSTGSMT